MHLIITTLIKLLLIAFFFVNSITTQTQVWTNRQVNYIIQIDNDIFQNTGDRDYIPLSSIEYYKIRIIQLLTIKSIALIIKILFLSDKLTNVWFIK